MHNDHKMWQVSGIYLIQCKNCILKMFILCCFFFPPEKKIEAQEQELANANDLLSAMKTKGKWFG